MQSNQMEERLETYFGSEAKTMSVRQTRKGCFQELLGCEAADEFKWFNTSNQSEGEQFATSLEESDCCMRLCCGGCHKFDMPVKVLGTDEEIMNMQRPMKCNAGPCKCCCYQEMTFTSGGQEFGKIEEGFYCCVPRMKILDGQGKPIYKVHSPTCIGGMCVNCCAEGNPCCGKGCCKVPFHIFPADQEDTDNGAAFAGKIVKVPKSMAVEIFTDSEAFDVHFPPDANATEKALIAGSAIFINAIFFESENNDE